MSYILEALKKAQAERQIGETPTIHAPAIAPVAAERAAGSRKPLYVGVGLLGGAVVIMGAMLLRQQAAAPASASATTPAPAPSSAPVPASAPAPVPAPAPAGLAPAQPMLAPAPAQAAAALPASAPDARSAKAVDAGPGPAPARKKVDRDVQADTPTASAPVTTTAPAPAASVTAAAPAGQAAPAAITATAAAAADEHIQSLRDLPEPIQRAVPPVTLGGYMYSKNPADRLILIDKALRKEGDEVAPGLQLEKLLPKAAVFSFRGYRYKVPL